MADIAIDHVERTKGGGNRLGGMIVLKNIVLVGALLAAAPALSQLAPGVRMPLEIGAAYGRLGRAMMTKDAAGVRTVWAEDFVVNSPNNEVLRREDVIAFMERDFLEYRNFQKHITYIGEKPEMTVVMGYDTMTPVRGPGAGKQVTRPFTDVWARRSEGWQLVARQATIAAAEAQQPSAVR
jgi:ketosteroid isomerase-like protein